jgi:hypothetical protein
MALREKSPLSVFSSHLSPRRGGAVLNPFSLLLNIFFNTFKKTYILGFQEAFSFLGFQAPPDKIFTTHLIKKLLLHDKKITTI